MEAEFLSLDRSPSLLLTSIVWLNSSKTIIQDFIPARSYLRNIRICDRHLKYRVLYKLKTNGFSQSYFDNYFQRIFSQKQRSVHVCLTCLTVTRSPLPSCGHVNFYQLVNQSAHEKLLEVFLFVCASFILRNICSVCFHRDSTPLCLCDNVWFTMAL